MKTIIKTIFAIVIFLSVTSCMFDGEIGNRDVQSKKRNISSDFIKIDAANGLDVILTYGEDPSVVVEADENLHEIIITEVKDGTLHIYTEKNIRTAAAKIIYVSASNINEIEASSGADLISENIIDTSELKISASSGSDIELRVDVTDLRSNASSGADIKLVGTATNLDVSASSGSDIKAYGLKVSNCKAKATSGADIKLNVIEKIDAKATSGADVKYKGNPKIVQHDESSAGDIMNQDG
ncbi:MAG: head GIN domain-containing protein [Bacteroidota bacterium]